MELDNVGVTELPHDGCLLQKLHFVIATFKYLHCNWYWAILGLADALLHRAKVARTQSLFQPVHDSREITILRI